MALLVAPLLTGLTPKFGIRPPMSAGVLMLGCGFILVSFAKRIWHLYLSQGVLVGLGVGCTYIPSIAVLSQWFSSRRSLANGISAAGTGIGGFMFSLAIGAMIKNISLAWSLRIVGIIIMLANTLAIMFIRDRNHIIRPASITFDITLLRKYDVLLLLAWSFISMLGFITLLFSLSDYAKSIRLSQFQAAQMTAFLNLGVTCGRPVIGVLSDRCGRLEVAGILTLTCGICCFAIWVPSTSFGVTAFFAIVTGAPFGIFWVASLYPQPSQCR